MVALKHIKTMKRMNKQNGMYALLIAVAALIGITIYASCSADEDYDGYSSKDELFTLADGEMSLRSDVVNGLHGSKPISNMVFEFRPVDHPNDSSLYIYDISNVTIHFSCDPSFNNATVDGIDLSFDSTEIYEINLLRWKKHNTYAEFAISAKIRRQINNITYKSIGPFQSSIQLSSFH